MFDFGESAPKGSLSPDGRTYFAPSEHTWEFWSVPEGRILRISERREDASQTAFTRDSNTLIAFDGRVDFWDVATGQLRNSGPLDLGAEDRHRRGSHLGFSVKSSPHGDSVAVIAGHHGVWLFDARTARLRGRISDSSDMKTKVAFSPDGQLLLMTNSSTNVRFWDVRTAQEQPPSLSLPTPVSNAMFTPDGRRCIVDDDDGRIDVYDVATRRRIHDSIQCLGVSVVSPDSSMLAATLFDQSQPFEWRSGLFDVETGLSIGPPLEGQVGFRHVFSPDSRYLARCGLGGDAWLTTLPPPLSDDPVLLRRWIETLTGFTDFEGSPQPLSAVERYSRGRQFLGTFNLWRASLPHRSNNPPANLFLPSPEAGPAAE